MKFVADEGVDAPIVEMLRNEGYSVYYILEQDAGLDDVDVLKLAKNEKSVLITMDKDFGTLAYRQKQVHAGIILIRLLGIKPIIKAEIVRDAIQNYSNEIINAFTVIQPGIVRIRKK